MADALSGVLDSVRMRGSVFSRAALAAPFGVASGRTASGIFHAVLEGSLVARLADDGPAHELSAGDLVVFPFGDDHLILDAPDTPARPIGTLTTVDEHGMGDLVVEGGGPETRLICGTIDFDAAAAHPVFSLLPRMIVVRDLAPEVLARVTTLVDLIASEVRAPTTGSETLIARLTDALLVHVLRAYIDGLEPGQGGWLGALKDPDLRRAIALIHERPDEPWSVEQLAATAGLSRSAFFERFKRAVGESPSEYLTRWRVHVASQLLASGDASVAAAARHVGYATEAGFSNAFLRVMGVRPGAYRRAALVAAG